MEEKTWTGDEIRGERQRLEQAAATLLGHLIFEYSSLDHALGLFLAWKGDGRNLEAFTVDLESASFYKRLQDLAAAVKEKYSERQEGLDAYESWDSKAHGIRLHRNRLMHGRWDVNAMAGVVEVVVGLATSCEQITSTYSIEELGAVVESVRELHSRMDWLRDAWPV